MSSVNPVPYLELFGLQNAHFSPIEHEDAMVAVVYRVNLPDSAPLILKICDLPRHYYRELAALKLLAKMPTVPHIKASIPPAENINGAILMECISGTVPSKQPITEAVAYELGITLSQVHITRMQDGGFSASQYFAQKFEEHLHECEHNLPPTLLQQCRSYYDVHLDLLHEADGPCMVHGDFHPGNIIVEQGSLRGIIDWATAHNGFAEEDLYMIEGGGWDLSDMAKDAFLRGYSTIRPVPAYQKMVSLLQLSKRLAIIGFTVRTDTWKTKHAPIYETIRSRLEMFMEVV